MFQQNTTGGVSPWVRNTNPQQKPAWHDNPYLRTDPSGQAFYHDPVANPYTPTVNPYDQTQNAQQAAGQQMQGSTGQWGVNTSITPQPMYQNELMRQLMNEAHADAMPTLSSLFARNQQQGVASNSPNVIQNTGIDLAKALSGGMAGVSNLGQQLSWANANNLLTGQSARDQEALGLGRLGIEDYGNQLAYDYGQQGNLLQLLRSLMGQWW